MVAPALPFLKLGSLLVKQITKPLASRLKIEAGKNKKFANICVFVGQKSHYVYSRYTVVTSLLDLKTIGNSNWL